MKPELHQMGLLALFVVVGCGAPPTAQGEDAELSVSVGVDETDLPASEVVEDEFAVSTGELKLRNSKCVRRGPVLGDYVDVCVRMFGDAGARGHYAGYAAMKSTNPKVRMQIDGVWIIRYKGKTPVYTPYVVNSAASRIRYRDVQSGKEQIQSGPTAYIRHATPSMDLRTGDFQVVMVYSIRWRDGRLIPHKAQIRTSGISILQY